jgi:hypothetical protein
LALGFVLWSLAIKIDSDSATDHGTLLFFIGDIGLKQFQERGQFCWLLEYLRANAPGLMN